MDNWLQKRAHLTPNRTAIVAGQTHYTFAQLAQHVAYLATTIAAQLPENTKRVAVLTTNSFNGYALLLALQHLNIEMVLLNRRLAAQELAYQINDAQVQHIFVDNRVPGAQWQTLPGEIILLDDLAPGDVPYVAHEIDLADVTTIMYTSGTTGQPKGVQQTYGNHWHSAIGSALNLGLQADDRWLAVVPIFHISGFSILMRGLIYGMTVELHEKFVPEIVNERLLSGAITRISLVPTMLKGLLAISQQTKHYPQALQTVLLGGGPVDRLTLEQAHQRGIQVIQSYGMTETASQIVALDMQDALRKIGSAGKPLFAVQLKIADVSGMHSQPPHESGYIWVKTPTLTPGYLHAKQSLGVNRVDGWFKTGDYGYVDEEGFLFIQGREGDMISSGGENIFPDEVEQAYAGYPNLDKIGVVGVPDDRWGAIPIAFVSGQHLTPQELIAYGRKHLAHYKVPKRFYRLSQWPMTASGKLQRAKLRTLLAQAEELKDEL
jgi:O-succinylbenzoic acid--CoA ligase